MKKILIVIDMQNDFIDGALGTQEAQNIVNNVINEINSFDGDVWATLDTHSQNYLQTREGKYLPVEHCIKDTYGWELNNSILSALDKKNARILEKPTFGSVILPKELEAKYDINDISVELIGLCTDICVVSNAMLLKAHFPEMNISVKESCCAGVTPEKHNAAIETMRSCQIDII